jgi:uncharacterized membrane protein YfcA
MTGAGGGALMTPMLVLLFSVKPATAISSDLVASLVMRPVGAAVHFARGTVNVRLVGWLAAGSVPAALSGTYVLHVVGEAHETEHDLTIALGGALLLGAAGMTLRYLLDRRAVAVREESARQLVVRPLPSLAIGACGGFVVGMTSVGAGSLMIVLLMFTYTRVSASQLVGTDLAQAIPLAGAAALGALLFGSISFSVTTAIVAGAVPAVLVGSLLSSRVPDRYLRPAITAVVFASGLRYVMPVAVAGWSAVAVVVGAVVTVALPSAWRVRKTALTAD